MVSFIARRRYWRTLLNGLNRRFPGARVWPPLPPAVRRAKKTTSEHDWLGYLPDNAEQEYLLEIYWVYVHPALPIIHKRTFMEAFREMSV